MKKTIYIICSILTLFVPIVSVKASVDLTGMAAVNVSSDTSSNAKKMALTEAREQIIKETISPFVYDKDNFNNVLKNADDLDLTNLVSSVNIKNEKQSATTYSANIKMTLNGDSVKNWLNKNNINNSVDVLYSKSKDKKNININLSNGLNEWIEFNQNLLSENINFTVDKISDRQVSGNISVSDNNKFISIMNKYGWKYYDNNNVLQINKQD